MPTRTTRAGFDRRLRWIPPVGNLGDVMILSAVLRAGHEATGERFGIHRVQPASTLFFGHPAVAQIASVDVEEAMVPLQRTDQWSLSFPNQPKSLRPYARLSLMLFGKVHGPEVPWAPVHEEDLAALPGLPFAIAPILLGPGVDSPRKEWPHARWVELAARLGAATAVPVVQVGVPPLKPIAGALNLTGKLGPRQLLALVGRSQACIGVDPFLTQAAQMYGTPALNLLGPVSERYAYPGQVNLQECRPCEQPCLDADRSPMLEPCPWPQPCMSRISVDQVFEAFASHLLPGLLPTRPLVG